MKKLSQEQFNELMQKALETQRDYPNSHTDTVATLVCSPYQERDDYDDIKFQVVYNLINQDR